MEQIAASLAVPSPVAAPAAASFDPLPARPRRRRRMRLLRGRLAWLTMGVWVLLPLMPVLGALMSWFAGVR